MRFINILAIWRYLIFCQIACGWIPRMRPMSIRQIINQISLLFWLPLSVCQRIKVHDSAAIHQFITLRRHFFELFLEQRRTERKMQEWFYYRFVRSMTHHRSPHRLTRRNFQYNQPLNCLYYIRSTLFSQGENVLLPVRRTKPAAGLSPGRQPILPRCLEHIFHQNAVPLRRIVQQNMCKQMMPITSYKRGSLG